MLPHSHATFATTVSTITTPSATISDIMATSTATITGVTDSWDFLSDYLASGLV